MPSSSVLAASCAILSLGLAACGGSSTNTSSPTTAASAPTSTQTTAATASTAPKSHPRGAAAAGGLTVGADSGGQLKFTKSSLSAKAGTVAIRFTNSSPVAHNLTIQQGTSGPTVGATPTFQGGSRTLTVRLAPGTYTFFCSVPGHRDGGMQGTLTVH